MTIDSAIEQIKEAILDLQASDYDTYGRPLQRLESVLESEELKPITDAMKSRVDFDAFLADANRDDEGTGGRAGLNWPDDRTEELPRRADRRRLPQGSRQSTWGCPAGAPRWRHSGGRARRPRPPTTFLMLVLIERGARDHARSRCLNVAYNYYHGGSKYIESIRKITRSAMIPFGRDFARITCGRADPACLLRGRSPPI